MIVSVALMFVVSLGVSAFVGESAGMVENMLTVVAALSVVLVCLVGPAMTSGAICADRETGVWDLLRTTRLPSWRIVSGKFQAAVIPLVLLALAIAPSAAILLYFNVNIWRNIVGVMEVLGVTILFVAACGLFFSSLFNRTPTATAWTYAVILTMGFLSLLMLLARDLFSRRLVRTVFLANPVAAAMDAAGHVGMQELALVDGYFRLLVSVSVLLLVITVLRVLQLRRADK
jgi:ABC-type transport system involved in multi-copper enzyme maturation permease subunit